MTHETMTAPAWRVGYAAAIAAAETMRAADAAAGIVPWDGWHGAKEQEAWWWARVAEAARATANARAIAWAHNPHHSAKDAAAAAAADDAAAAAADAAAGAMRAIAADDPHSAAAYVSAAHIAAMAAVDAAR